jgi:hypothetical protein
MITRLSAIPNNIMKCEFVIVTHKLPNTNYVFEGDSIYKVIGNQIKPISTYISGRCKVVKINGKPISLSKLKKNRVNFVDVYVKNIQQYPF